MSGSLGSLQIQQFKEQMRLEDYAGRSIKDYGMQVGFFFKYLEEEEYLKSIDEIRPEHIRSYHLSLLSKENKGRNFAKKTIRTKLGALKAFFRLMHKAGFMSQNFETVISIPKIKPEPPKNIPSVKEVSEYLDSIVPDSPITIRDRVIVELLYNTGIRNKQLRELTVDNLDLVDQKLFVGKIKRGESIILPVGEWLVPLLTKYLYEIRKHFAPANCDLLFPSKNGKQLTQANLRDMVQKYAKRLGTSKRFTPHIFRHCIATHLINAGLGIRYVQQLLGHSDISSTIIYTHLATDNLKMVHSKYHPRQRTI